MDRLSALDTSFLHLEGPTTPMHISSLAIYEGPAPRDRDLRDMLEARLHLVPRFRQRIATVPFNQHRPVWIDDPNFDLDAHLHHVALPAPGNEQQLKDVVCQLLATPIDRCRPLWEMWLIDDLFGKRFAILSKVHHALWDGVTGADLHAVLLDASPEPSHEIPEMWMPRPEPTKAILTNRDVIAVDQDWAARSGRGARANARVRNRRIRVDEHGRGARAAVCAERGDRKPSPLRARARVARRLPRDGDHVRNDH